MTPVLSITSKSILIQFSFPYILVRNALPSITHQQYDDIVSSPALAQLSPIPSPYNGLILRNFNARNDGVSILRSIDSPVSTRSQQPVHVHRTSFNVRLEQRC